MVAWGRVKGYSKFLGLRNNMDKKNNNLAFEQRGILRIDVAFKKALIERTAALMPYFTLGYPDRSACHQIIKSVASHSDLLELGIPFSDPLADGPTIQRSTQISLEKGTTTAVCFDMLRDLRQDGVDTPVLLMGYYNTVLAYGEDKFVIDAAGAGADGFIIADLPPEEAEEFEQFAIDAGLAMIYFLAPTSNPARIKTVVERAKGFIYLVSLTGVTGARSELNQDLEAFVTRVRKISSVPLALGFGISTPEQAAFVGRIADGVIVGSALINEVDVADDKPGAAVQYIKSLGSALAI